MLGKILDTRWFCWWGVWSILLLTGVVRADDSAVDQSELAGVKIERAFPKLRIRRPVVIANANDGSNRLFFCTQQGVIHVIPNDQNVSETTTFLDIEDNVKYDDRQNEEGLLGLAFHPRYAENGQFFIYYTTNKAPLTSVISRFRVSADDPNRADPDSEEELLRIEQPYWNHNGGTLVFGPDGYLYIGLGDGGKFNDPHMNGQNLQTLLGSILRIDIDHRDEGLAYAIPKDNPFYGQERFARGEIFAYGFRNVWRMSFDRETGRFWAADVGQDLWEEINIVRPGGNYGWNLREATHKFGPGGASERDDLIEPIWEYHHDIGKSITGGHVYRGTKTPQLTGSYIYADYVSGKTWALTPNEDGTKTLANRQIPGPNIPIVTFGEDEAGELYFTDSFGMVYQIVPAN